jgi:uncharacterized coiled-coil protein SlyX
MAEGSRADQADPDRIDTLEQTVAELQTQVAVLQELVERLIDSARKGT